MLRGVPNFRRGCSPNAYSGFTRRMGRAAQVKTINCRWVAPILRPMDRRKKGVSGRRVDDASPARPDPSTTPAIAMVDEKSVGYAPRSTLRLLQPHFAAITRGVLSKNREQAL